MQSKRKEHSRKEKETWFEHLLYAGPCLTGYLILSSQLPSVVEIIISPFYRW